MSNLIILAAIAVDLIVRLNQVLCDEVAKRYLTMTLHLYVSYINILLSPYQLPSSPCNHGSIVKADVQRARVHFLAVLVSNDFYHLSQDFVARNASNEVHSADRNLLDNRIVDHKLKFALYLCKGGKLSRCCVIEEVL